MVDALGDALVEKQDLGAQQAKEESVDAEKLAKDASSDECRDLTVC